MSASDDGARRQRACRGSSRAARPVVASPTSTTGKWRTLPVWMSVSASNSSSSVPKPPGRMTNAVGVLHEHRLAREEVAELDAEVDVRVEVLLVRQLDVAADRQAAALRQPRFAASMMPGPAAGDHRVARLGQLPADRRARARSRVGSARSAPSRTPSPPARPRPARRSPRRTRTGSAAPATGRCRGRPASGPALEELLVLGRGDLRVAMHPRPPRASPACRPARRVLSGRRRHPSG